jgi:hypothetical protein
MFCHAVFLEAAVFEKSEPPFHFGIILIYYSLSVGDLLKESRPPLGRNLPAV